MNKILCMKNENKLTKNIGLINMHVKNPYRQRISKRLGKWIFFQRKKKRKGRKFKWFKFWTKTKKRFYFYKFKKNVLFSKVTRSFYKQNKSKFVYNVLKTYWKEEYKMAVSFNMLYKKLNSMLLISRFLKNTIYLIKNTKWRISKLQLFNLNNHLSSFNYFRLKNEAGIQHTRKWTISGLTWLSLYSFFGSYFLEKFKKRYIFLINKCVISLQLKVFRYNVYLIISDGFNKKLYTYFTLKKTFPMERRKARMRMKNIKELCRSHLTNFLKLKKNKNFKYCIVILKSLHYRSTVIINILGQLNWKKLKLSILGIKIGNEKAHNGLRLPKRRRC